MIKGQKKVNILVYLSPPYEKNWFKGLFKALTAEFPDVTIFAIERPLTLIKAILSLGKKKRKPAIKDTRIVNFKPLSLVHDRIAYMFKPLAWLNKLMIEFQIKLVIKKYGTDNGVDISWIFHPYQHPYSGYLNPAIKIYYVYDDYFFQKFDLAAKTKLEFSILSKVNIVYVASKALLSRYSSLHNNVRLLPNGVSKDFIKTGRKDYIFDEISRLKPPLICTHGYISDRMDVELIFNLAKVHPEWSLIFLGKCARSFSTKWNAILRECSNIYHYQEIDWTKITVYLRAMDVLIMPYRKNNFNIAASPVRFIQAMAVGKPLITPHLPYAEEGKDVVYFAETLEQYSAIVKKIMENGEDPDLSYQRIQYADHHSWENKAKGMMQDIGLCNRDSIVYSEGMAVLTDKAGK